MYEIKGTRLFKECNMVIEIECKFNDLPSEDDSLCYKGVDFVQNYVGRLGIDCGHVLFNNEIIALINLGEVHYLE